MSRGPTNLVGLLILHRFYTPENPGLKFKVEFGILKVKFGHVCC
jgi:hypothetical protein